MTCAIYILNLCPTKILNTKTPEEVWTGRKPKFSHLRVFSLLCYVHILEEKRKKLDDKSEKAIMVGYHSTSGYRLVVPTSNRLLINKEVLFDEKNT